MGNGKREQPASRAGWMSRRNGWRAGSARSPAGTAGWRAPDAGRRRSSPSGPRTARWRSAMCRSRRCRRRGAGRLHRQVNGRARPAPTGRSACCWSGWAATPPGCSGPGRQAGRLEGRLPAGARPQRRGRHVPAPVRPAPGEAGQRGAGRGRRHGGGGVRPVRGRLDAVVLGGDRRAIAGLADDPRLRPLLRLAVDRFLTVPDPRLAVLRGHAAAVPRHPDPAHRAGRCPERVWQRPVPRGKPFWRALRSWVPWSHAAAAEVMTPGR